jgi:DNA replication initiation complex subunit (GINS family)
MTSNLTDEQRQFYEDARQRTRSEVEEFEGQIKVELDKVKERIQGLQDGAKAARQMYDAACLMLGEPNEFDDEEAED